MNEFIDTSACSPAHDSDSTSTSYLQHKRQHGVWALPDPVFSEDAFGDAVDRAWEELRDAEDI